MEAMPSVFAAPEASCLAYVVLGTLRLGQSLPPGRGNLTLVSAPAPHFPGAGAFATRCYRCAEHPVTPLRLSQEPAISRGGRLSGSTWLIDSAVLPPLAWSWDSDHAGASGKLRMEYDRQRSIRQRRHPAGNRRSGRTLQAPKPMQAYRVWLDQLEQGNVSHGHTGEVEAVPWRATEAMTSCGFQGWVKAAARPGP